MNFLETSILRVLPGLNDVTKTKIVECLHNCGVDEEGDLPFVEEKDLLPVLKSIQARKLVVSWKNEGKYIFILAKPAYNFVK